MNFDIALAALDHHHQSMPPVAALRLRIAGFDGACLRLPGGGVAADCRARYVAIGKGYDGP